MTANKTPLQAGLLALGIQIASITSSLAGGAALLELPINGVTPENSKQCVKLFEDQLGDVLSGWTNTSSRDVSLIEHGTYTSIRMRLGRGHISLTKVEEILEGSPFSLKREQLEFVGVIRLRLEKVDDPEKFAAAIAKIDGKNLRHQSATTEDGQVIVTLSERNNDDTPLFTHQRLRNFLDAQGAKLVAIDWGISPEKSWTDRENIYFHCRKPYGARPVKAIVARN